MFWSACGASNGFARLLLLPSQVLRTKLEYCIPICVRPIGPLYRRYQKPIEPSITLRVSPVQPDCVPGIKPLLPPTPVGTVVIGPLVGRVSTLHRVLLFETAP